MSNISPLWSKVKSVGANGTGFRRFDIHHSLDFYAGFDGDDNHAFLIVCKVEPPLQSDMRSIRVKIRSRTDGKWSLFLVLEDVRLLDIFMLLCEDLINCSAIADASSTALTQIFARLGGWRQLLERGDTGLLSENQIRGLCGELFNLQILIEQFGPDQAVNSWVGPFKADQDFVFPELAWEVKTIRPGALTFKVASERQFDTSVRALNLVLVELSAAQSTFEKAFSLNLFVSHLEAKLQGSFDARLAFDHALFSSGYTRRPEYDLGYFSVRDCSFYHVRDSFPSMVSADLPPGVRDVSYTVELALCKSFRFGKLEESKLGLV